MPRIPAEPSNDLLDPTTHAAHQEWLADFCEEAPHQLARYCFPVEVERAAQAERIKALEAAMVEQERHLESLRAAGDVLADDAEAWMPDYFEENGPAHRRTLFLVAVWRRTRAALPPAAGRGGRGVMPYVKSMWSLYYHEAGKRNIWILTAPIRHQVEEVIEQFAQEQGRANPQWEGPYTFEVVGDGPTEAWVLPMTDERDANDFPLRYYIIWETHEF